MSISEAPKFDLQQLFGEQLLWKVGGAVELKPTTELSRSRSYVGIYFSAHWCPPCRQFTPQLASTYRLLQDKQTFEIVFVSSDRNVEAFSEYFATMPWAAVPFGEYALRKKLASTFHVLSIPALIILGPDGSLVNASARPEVSQDPRGLRFPWHGSKQLKQGMTLDANKAIAILILLYLAYQILF